MTIEVALFALAGALFGLGVTMLLGWPGLVLIAAAGVGMLALGMAMNSRG